MYNKSKDSICVFSYNSRGFLEEKQDICNILFVDTENYYPILCNQENFLLKGNNYKVTQCLPNARVIFKEATKESIGGRPKNGMFIAVPLEIKELAVDVSPSHWRVQAIILSTPNNKFLIINSYFPTDPRVNEFDTTDLFSTLSAIDDLLKEHNYDNVIWCGDINADFIRNTVFTTTIDRFVIEMSLEKSWDKYSIDFTHSLEREEHTYTSTLDHFFWSEGVTKNVVAADVLHLPSKTSDHCPIYCTVNTKTMYPKKSVHVTTQPKPSWKRATDEQKADFNVTLKQNLQCISIPTNVDSCRDVHCRDEEHMHECDEFLVSMLETIKSTAASCLPTPSGKTTNLSLE